jgi:O-antigen ligase
LPFTRQALTTSRIFWVVAVYLLAIAVASALLPDMPQWLLNRPLRMSPMVLYFVIITASLTMHSRLGFANFLLLCTAILATSEIINIAWFVSTRPFQPDFPDTFRLTASLGMPLTENATNLSITYAVYSAGSFAMIRDEPTSWRRILFGFFGVTLLIGVLMTQARSAYLAVLLSVLVLVLAGSRGRPPRIALVGGIAFAAVVLVLLLLVPTFRHVIDSRGVSHRPEIWLYYLRMAAHRPFLGYGMAPNIDQILSDGSVIPQPHNIVLSALIRGGIIGCAAMMAVLAQCLYWSYRASTTFGQIAPLCMLIAMTTASMFDYQLLPTNPSWEWVTFWLPTGIAIGLETAGRSAISPCSWKPAMRENEAHG